MFKFDKKQEVFELGGVKFGGQPGENPTVLVSTMFYARHKIELMRTRVSSTGQLQKPYGTPRYH